MLVEALESGVEAKVLVGVVALKIAIEQYKGHVNPDIIKNILEQVKLTGGPLSMEISKT